MPLEDLLNQAIEDLVEAGGVVRSADGLSLEVKERRLVGELAELVRNFHESYLLVLLAARALRSQDIALDDLAGRVQTWGKVRLAVDELRRPESLSMVGIRNAVRAFREEGVLQVKSGGGFQFEERAWDRYSGDLRSLLLQSVP